MPTPARTCSQKKESYTSQIKKKAKKKRGSQVKKQKKQKINGGGNKNRKKTDVTFHHHHRIIPYRYSYSTSVPYRLKTHHTCTTYIGTVVLPEKNITPVLRYIGTILPECYTPPHAQSQHRSINTNERLLKQNTIWEKQSWRKNISLQQGAQLTLPPASKPSRSSSRCASYHGRTPRACLRRVCSLGTRVPNLMVRVILRYPHSIYPTNTQVHMYPGTYPGTPRVHTLLSTPLDSPHQKCQAVLLQESIGSQSPLTPDP